MRILITGAGGILGSALVESLKNHHEVHGLGRNPVPFLSIPFHLCDLTNPEKTQSTLEKIRPEIVFHCAAMTQVDLCEEKPDQAYQQNVLATQNLIQAIKPFDSTLIFFSSDYVFDGEGKTPYQETDSPNPKSIYGKTKLQAEELIRKNCAHYFIFRISWLFGFHGTCFPDTILRVAKEKKALRIVNDQLGGPTYSKDVAYAMLSLFNHFVLGEKSLNQVFHLSNHGYCSWYDFGSFLIKNSSETQFPIQMTAISTQELNRKAPRPTNSRFNLDKTNRLLKINLRPWQEASLDYLQNRKNF